MTAPEFSRPIDVRHLPGAPLTLSADEGERRRLAGRFGLSAIDRLDAELRITADDAVIRAEGRLRAAVIQPCAVSGEDFAVTIDEPLDLRFVPPGASLDSPGADEEIELTADECDEIDYDGLSFDLGEAVAQSLALAIDPFATGPEADRARAEHNLAGNPADSPFAALAALKPPPQKD